MKLPIFLFVFTFAVGEVLADSFTSLAGVVISVSDESSALRIPGATIEVDGARTEKLVEIKRFNPEAAEAVKALVAEAILPKTTDSRGNCIVYAYGRGAGENMSVHGKVKVSKKGYEPVEIDLSKVLDPKGLGTFKSFPLVSVSLKRLSEQGDARRPATGAEAKSEGKEKPKPESEGRSQ